MKMPSLKFLALTCAGALVLSGGCKKPSTPPRDYSQAQSVSVTLRKPNREEGLRQVEPVKALQTTPARVGGFDCRSLKIPDKQEGFIYFLIDPTFKAANARDVKVMVDYFDATQGRFMVEYDSQSEKYTRTQRVIDQRGTAQWKTAEFILPNTRFENLQDNNADFRLRIRTPEFFIRRVEVSRDTTLTTSDEPALEQVSIVLQEKPVEDGLHLINESDGKSTPAVMAGQPCRHLDRKYLYFAIDPSFKSASTMNVKVEVEYFDASTGQLDLHYDSWSRQGDSAYRRGITSIPLQQAQKWQTGTFILPEARFENRQNGRADFRLYATSPDVYVRSVKVLSTELPEPPGPANRYATSNSVSLILGAKNQSAGLHQAYDPDSRTYPAVAEGENCIAVHPARSGQSYLYFAVDPSFKRQEPANYLVEVEYFSPLASLLRVHYNSRTPGGALEPYRTSPAIAGQANTWTTAQIFLSQALFKGTQNGKADFRLVSTTPSLHVRKVTLLHVGQSTRPR